MNGGLFKVSTTSLISFVPKFELLIFKSKVLRFGDLENVF